MDLADPRRRLLELTSDIRREQGALERVAADVQEALTLLERRAPTRLEVRGAGDLLHDYYTGAEKVFVRVAVAVDGGKPGGDSWRAELLASMGQEVARLRPPVVSDETRRRLHELLRFRHLFRNVYGHDLEWSRIRELLAGLAAVHGLLRRDLADFLAFLDRLAGDTRQET